MAYIPVPESFLEKRLWAINCEIKELTVIDDWNDYTEDKYRRLTDEAREIEAIQQGRYNRWPKVCIVVDARDLSMLINK